MQIESLSYNESVAYMSGLLTFGMKLDRERFAELLRRIGDPHKALRCVHVAGTNGKGSTTTFIASILLAAGFKVGSYLSPYVFDVRERILVNGVMISREDFARHVSVIKPHIEAVAETELGQTTEFELKTAVAFRHFAEIGVDFAVVEVGIGGRLDATNVIPPPLVAVITNIGLDHQKILGETIEEIAAEKAGILKTGTACCVTGATGAAFDVIQEIADARGVPVLRVRPEDEAAENEVSYHALVPNGVSIGLPENGGGFYELKLPGLYQAANASTAMGVVYALRKWHGIVIPTEAESSGLQAATLPGRFETHWIKKEAHSLLVLDVAHNEDGASELLESLRAYLPESRFTFVVGMSKTHDPQPFLQVLQPLIHRLIVTEPNFRPKPARETLNAAQELGIADVTLIAPAYEAIRQAAQNAGERETVVVTGSFYTVGETPESLREP